MTDMPIWNGNTIELHYWFNDNTHTMSATIFNKCEYEFLGIAKEIARKLKVDIEIEIGPLEKGGLRSWLSFNSKDKDALKVGIVLYLITNVLCGPIAATVDELTRLTIRSVFESEEVKKLRQQKEIAELKFDIAKLEAETAKLSHSIDKNVIKKKRSNYYESLNSCDKIDKISVSITDRAKDHVYLHKEIMRDDFPGYIMSSDDIEPDCDENAVIEIVSPVLKKGKYNKWMGIYNGDVIPFSMKSKEFKSLVQTGKVQFKNGSSINCHLMINKKITAEGEVYVSRYEVILVNHYFENDKPIETPEGQRKRQSKEYENQQLSLFSDVENIKTRD